MVASVSHPLLISIHRELGISADYAQRTGLPLFEEVSLSELVVAQLDEAGRPLVLTKSAAHALGAMRAAAMKDGIELLPFSGFRSYLYQRGLLLAKIAKGTPIDEVLTVLAAPGYSEHHTGEAVDITTHNCPPAEEAFEATHAYAWLATHAGTYGFTESFPRGNPHSLVYEPWHWKFRVP
jgi:D-alanyl-D-alanine carboxypeptidase